MVECEGTPKTRALCEAIASATHGVCLLGFSRGKDSVAAWLWLRRFFPRIIPFHAAAVPHLKFADESLAYYEKVFDTPIERFLCGHVSEAIGSMIYQPIEDQDAVGAMGLLSYDNHDIAQLLRRKHNVSRAWCAFGISASDSIDRRIYVGKYAGRNDARRTFYPCFDWPAAIVRETIAAAGVRLPNDYQFNNRSFAGVPGPRGLDILRDTYPAEFARVKLVYPFIEAQLARMEFRRMRSSGTEKMPGIPRTANGSTGHGGPSTQTKSSGAPSQQAASSSPAQKGRQSRTSTKHKAIFAGSSL